MKNILLYRTSQGRNLSNVISESPFAWVSNKEHLEGWTMVAVETVANGDSRSTYEKVLFWLVVFGLVVQEILFYLGCSSRPRTKYCFPSPYTISIPLSPSPYELGRQPCWVACLFECVSVVMFKCEGLRLNAGASWIQANFCTFPPRPINWGH